MQPEISSVGTFRARAVPNAEWGGRTAMPCRSSQKGTPYIGVLLEVTEGDNTGERAIAELYMTEASRDRSIESLFHCGWDGEDLNDLSTVGSKECQIVVAEEEYKGNIRYRVQWVNAIGASGIVPGPMSEEQRKIFAASMRGAVHKVRERLGGKPAAQPAAAAKKPAPPHPNKPGGAAEPPPISDDPTSFP